MMLCSAVSYCNRIADGFYTPTHVGGVDAVTRNSTAGCLQKQRSCTRDTTTNFVPSGIAAAAAAAATSNVVISPLPFDRRQHERKHHLATLATCCCCFGTRRSPCTSFWCRRTTVRVQSASTNAFANMNVLDNAA